MSWYKKSKFNYDCKVLGGPDKSPLHCAIEVGNMAHIQNLLNKGGFINSQDRTGCTPLHYAIKEGYDSIAELLLHRGAKVNICDTSGLSPLHTAVRNGNLQLVLVLLNYGAKIDAKSNDNSTPLHDVVKYGPHYPSGTDHFQLFNFLISKGASFDALNDKNQTPLNFAFGIKNRKVLDFLLEKGASIRHIDSSGVSLLHLAAESGNYEVTEKLLQKCLNVNAVTKNNDTPLSLALSKGNKLICQLLINCGAKINFWYKGGKTALFIAVETDNYEVAKLILRKGANVNAASKKYVSPLYMASKIGNIRMCELLSEFGANCNVSDIDGKSPLHIATESDSYEIAKLFLQKGVNVDAVTKKNITSLYIASSNGNKQMCELLLEFRANCYVSDKDGKSPLHIAVENDKYETAEFLLLKGVNVNAIANNIITPLYIASSNGSKRMCELLLSFHANCNISDQDGKSPLFVAVKKNRYEIAELLLRNNADVHKRSNNKMSPLCISTESENEKLFPLLLKYCKFQVSAEDAYNDRIVLAVIKNGFLDIFEDLLRHGMDINMVFKSEYFQWKLLHATVKFNQKDMTKLLISHGADVDIYDKYNQSLLTYAVESGDIEIIQLILRQVDVNRNCNSFNLAVWLGNIEIVNILLHYGYNIKLRDKFGRTALHFTTIRYGLGFLTEKKGGDDCARGRIAKLLVERGVDMNAEDDDGETAMISALRYANSTVVQTLLLNNVDPNFKITDIWCEKVLEELLIDGCLKCRHSPVASYCYLLHAAAAYYPSSRRCEYETASLKILEQLLVCGADVDCQTEIGLTPLHIAISVSNRKAVQTLLRYGADPNIGDIDGETVLHLASLRAESEIFKLLLDNDCSINVFGRKNRSLFHYIKKGTSEWKSRWDRYDSDSDNGHTISSDYDLLYDRRRSSSFNDDHFGNDIEDYEYEDCEQVVVTRHLYRHIVKLKTANMFLNYAFLNAPIIHVARSFQEDCEVEIATMQSEYIADSSISFYEILTCTPTQLVEYMRRENFAVAVKTAELEKYAIYKGMLESKLTKAGNRRKLLNDLESIFQETFPVLPLLCAEKIINFFSDQEIRKILFVCGIRTNLTA